MASIGKIFKRNKEKTEALVEQKNENIRVLTLGSFDHFNVDHRSIVDRALQIATKEENLVIAVSSDKWNRIKGKNADQDETVRINTIKEAYPNATVILEDHDAPEASWPKMYDDYDIDLIVMGGTHYEMLSYFNGMKSLKGKEMKIKFF